MNMAVCMNMALAECKSVCLLYQSVPIRLRVLQGWQRYTETTQRNHYKEAWFQCAREQRLVRDCLACWQEGLRKASLRQAALEHRLGQLNMRLVARTVQYWRAAARGRVAQKRYSRNLLQQVW